MAGPGRGALTEDARAAEDAWVALAIAGEAVSPVASPAATVIRNPRRRLGRSVDTALTLRAGMCRFNRRPGDRAKAQLTACALARRV